MNHFEIEACVIRAKNGNKRELLKIMEQYKPFIIKTASKFSIKTFDAYDYLQIGYVALINAVAKYRTGSSTFSTYAYKSIQNAFKYAARQNTKAEVEMSLNELVDDDDNPNEFINCIEALENIEEDILKLEKAKEIRSVISKLPSVEMEFVIMVYYNDMSLQAYAEKAGISYQQAIRRKNKVLEKLSHFIIK